MCGIAGIVRGGADLLDREEITRMTRAVAHRGPDGEGFFLRGPIALGHRRLAIIDLATGQQPMTNEDQTIWVTYNGEIYNYRELRTELEQHGHVFHTRSDTEVIVHGYEEWGKECVRRLRGMFAFGLADFRQQTLFLARDHFGIKPLYYRVGKNYVAFASELPALREVQDDAPTGRLTAVELFLRFQYIPTPDTIYAGVCKLPPASHLTVSFDGLRLDGPTRYWDLAFEPGASRTPAEWEEEAEAVIEDSVRAHLVADVPFGGFCSGGVDSTLVACAMSKLLGPKVSAFTIGFEEQDYSEVSFAEVVAKKLDLDLHTETVSIDKLDVLPDLVRRYGEPFGDSSALPTYYVSRLARSRVPMVLSGDGGDELFGGYHAYMNWMTLAPRDRLKNAWRVSPARKFPRAILSVARQALLDGRYPLRHWQSNILYTDARARRRLWKPEFESLVDKRCEIFEEASRRAQQYDRLAYAQYVDAQTYLPCCILAKVDVASMYHGLEVRTPLIDVQVAEFAARLPLDQRLAAAPDGRFTGKAILKRVLAKKFPAEFVHRRKQGFAIPREHWFLPGHPGRAMAEDLLMNSKSRLYEFFRPDAVSGFLSEHSAARDHSGVLWLLLVFGIWLEQNREIRFA